jgi:hypothetical protein
MEFWISDADGNGKPKPERKRKNVVNALESHEEYLKMKNVILSGRMKPMQSAVITMGPADSKQLGYKWPWRTAVDSLRRLVKSMGLQSDYTIRKYETSTSGVWAILATYEPPMTAAQPRSEAPRQPAARPRKRA